MFVAGIKKHVKGTVMSNDQERQEILRMSQQLTVARQKELQQAYDENREKGKAPYAQVSIRTLDEVRWIMQERGWSGDYRSQAINRSDWREADFRQANLDGADFRGAILKEADFYAASLRHADFRWANLNGAYFASTDLQGARLRKSNLGGTVFFEADLRGADLTVCRLDPMTVLIDVVLDSTTKLGDISWNGALLNQIDWNQIPTLGDDILTTSILDSHARIQATFTAARAYQGLANALKGQGSLLIASRFRQRGRQLERQALFLTRKPLQGFGSWLLDIVAGYGEKPGRIFVAYLLVIFVFATGYLGISHVVETGLAHLSWDEALVLSLTSFHGRGFFPGFLSLGDWVSRLAALEAIIGLFIELLLIATFSHRFLDN